LGGGPPAKSMTMSDEPKGDQTPPAKPEAKTPEAAPKVEVKGGQEDPPSWTVEKMLADIGMPDLKPGDARLKQWDDVKSIVKKTTEINNRLTVEKSLYEKERSDLTTQLEEARKGIKDGSSTPADVKAIQAELAGLKSQHEKESAELKEYKAKDNLLKNDAFRQRFDGGRAKFFNEAKEAALEAGVEMTKLDEVFNAKSELSMRQALAELMLSDLVAEKLITEKALGHLSLTKEQEQLLSGKSGKKASELAAEWEGYQAQLGGAIGAQVSAKVQGELLEAVGEAKTTLGEAHPFFKGEAGMAILEELESRFRLGMNLPVPEVIESLALAQTAPVWEKMAMEMSAQVRVLQAQLAKFTKNTAAGATTPGTSEVKAPATTLGENSAYTGTRGGDIVLNR